MNMIPWQKETLKSRQDLNLYKVLFFHDVECVLENIVRILPHALIVTKRLKVESINLPWYPRPYLEFLLY